MRLGQAGHLAARLVIYQKEGGIAPIETIANEYWTTQVGCDVIRTETLPYVQWCGHASRGEA
jgi:hypothetical protein